jgi:ABC-type lipoprotein release transport system permease subunit
LVFPSQVVVRLLSVLGQADWLLRAIGYAAGVIAALTMVLSLYWSAASREGEALVLRLIGAEKRDIAAILAWEGLLSIAPGLVAGCAAGHAILMAIAGVLERKASLHVDTGPGGTDAALILALLLAGTAGETLAALQLTRNTNFT